MEFSFPVAADAKKSIAIDLNILICPYKLGGTCTDDQCPYQHLREDDDGNEKVIMRLIALNFRHWEGCI